MDGRIEQELERANKRLEATLEIVIEHFKDTEERIEKLEDRLKELEKDA